MGQGDLRHERIAGEGGVSLHVTRAGSGPLVVLLHGFPENSSCWRHQIGPLAEAGFSVLVPDLRGYGLSDKPAGREPYRLRHLAADVAALVRSTGHPRAHVVGHDWGAGLAWVLAALVPERVDRLVVLSVGHPNTGREPSVEQREKSWYMLLFQFEGTAEELLSRDDWKLAREWIRGDGDSDRYFDDLARPGALTAALNWYRANPILRFQLGDRLLPAVAAPTLGIWSDGDAYLLEEGLLRFRHL